MSTEEIISVYNPNITTVILMLIPAVPGIGVGSRD